MDVEARMKIVDQDLNLLRTLQSQGRRCRSGDVSLHIKTLEKELIALDIINKIDHELERFKELDLIPVAGSIDTAANDLKRARKLLVEEQTSLASKTSCSSLLCSSMNIKDAFRKLKALESNYSDNLLSDINISSAIDHLESADEDVKLLLTQTKAFDGMTEWCVAKVESFFNRLLS
uniref:uncharacterized protein LOC105353100 n=1 Tax=Fragaria vesca subsp. vesca TaxID=101020 RepID=UPI0005C88B26|nr:PREDICTED: uncharacterized protein LOC105353100 [Fragaria vesca subsp. vesca]